MGDIEGDHPPLARIFSSKKRRHVRRERTGHEDSRRRHSLADAPEKPGQYVQAATCLTHRDSRALTGAMAVALTAAHRTRHALGKEDSPYPLVRELAEIAPDDEEWQRFMQGVQSGLGGRRSLQEFARSLGLSRGVTGYMYHTVPVCLYALYRHGGDFKTGMESLLNLGGDTDTMGAIYGAIAGMDGTIPEEWIRNLRDFPCPWNFLNVRRALFHSCRRRERGCIPAVFPGMRFLSATLCSFLSRWGIV